MTSGYVSDLLAPLYGRSRSALVDRIGVPVNATATVGDYVLSADAVIGDRYNIALVYTLQRTDGKPLEDGLSFSKMENSLCTSTGGGSTHYELTEDKAALSIVEKWTFSKRMFPRRQAHVVFTDLVDSAGNTIAAGSWELNFTARYRDASVRVPVLNPTFTDIQGQEYRIKKLLLSPIGIHMDLAAPNPHLTSGTPANPFAKELVVSLRLTNGSIEKLEEYTRASSGRTDADTIKAHWGAMYKMPIPLEAIKAVNVCDRVITIQR